MSTKNPLESITFIKIPENFKFSESALKIDPSIPLPAQKKDSDAPGNFNMSELSREQILAGILTVLAYDTKNEHAEYYRDIIKQAEPNILKNLSEAAILKTKNEDWELAEELFRSLKGLEPENKGVALNFALFLDQRAESYRRSNLNEDADAYDADAMPYYKEAMNAEPAIPDAFFNAGFFYLKQHKFRDAKNAFETFLALAVDTYKTNDQDADDNAQYKIERAQEIVNEISNENMDDVTFQNAYALIKSGQEEKGLEECGKFLQANPKVWNAWFLLGWGLRRLSRFNDAKQAFEKALEFGADKNSETYNELAICEMEEGKLEEAKKYLFKALALDPESTKIISNLGFIEEKKGNKDEAQKYFTAVLEIDPKDQIAANELARLENLD